MNRILSSTVPRTYRASCAHFSTSRPLLEDVVTGTAVTSVADGGSAFTGAADSAAGGALTNVDVSSVATLAEIAKEGPRFGEVFSNAFSWIPNILPSFGGGSPVWHDVVHAKLTHLYLPSLYQFIQGQTGLSWFAVIGCGTITLRLVLFVLPITRNSMQFPRLMQKHIPEMTNQKNLLEVAKESKDKEMMKKISQMMQDYRTKHKMGSVIMGFLASGISMLIINRSLLHLSHLRSMKEGGIEPFLDMSFQGDCTGGFYILPVIMTSALVTNAIINTRHNDWFSPRLAVVGVPAAGLLIYFMSARPVPLILHYSISAWTTTFLFAASHNEFLRQKLRLPEPFKPEPPRKPEVLVTTHKREIPEYKFPDVNLIKSPPKHPSLMETTDEQGYEEKILGELRETTERKQREYEDSSYMPYFKLRSHHAEEKSSIPDETMSDNCPAYSDPGFTDKVKRTTSNFDFRPIKKTKAWLYRNKLMRHGRKGLVKEFLQEAPLEQNFLKEPVELTTKVTPGLKRYVLRRQYPMNTLEEMERKASYIERVQNQRW